MAEIHVFPARPSSANRIARLDAELLVAQAQRIDLGPRAAHMYAHGAALQSLGRDLEVASDALHQTLSQLGMQDQQARNTLNWLLGEVRELAASAARYPRRP